MPLHALMGWPGPMTHRQFLAWQAWLSWRADRPEPIHYYLMQIACEVRRLFRKRPGAIKLLHFLLDFGTDAPGKKRKGTGARTREEAAAWSKAAWAARLGIKPSEMKLRPAKGLQDPPEEDHGG